jgi:hypothetical protein
MGAVPGLAHADDPRVADALDQRVQIAGVSQRLCGLPRVCPGP